MFSKPSRAIDRVFLHCSASDHDSHDNVKTMRRWHLDRGWSDVGYHYFIRKDGTLENGRPVSKTPAAQGGNNKGTIAICCHGLKEHLFTDAQFKTLKKLCLEIENAYDGRITFHGHREVASKACPVFDYKDILKLNSHGILGLPGAKGQKMINTTSLDGNAMPTIRIGDRGKAVAMCQKLLMLKDDGIFGPRTKATVMEFQRKERLKADGIVGKSTWRNLLQLKKVDHGM